MHWIMKLLQHISVHNFKEKLDKWRYGGMIHYEPCSNPVQYN
ncbi:hypothetical protein E2C01_076338 [Portunus trituberculatus]|uniref:Uncharacterized protein n=1 Tax=Portunus trituberculatus TaxID=210409 RepID=A0A5B7IIA4_PORTR|nr:hypothetical protein [Portunus trituberculatus]